MAARTAPARRGFSFVEILFAVMILGIGFIMLAALFPVAISQSQATRDDVAGTAQSKNAVALLRARYPEMVTGALLPATDAQDPAVTPVLAPFTVLARPRVYSMSDPRLSTRATLWPMVRSIAVSPADPATGATLLYSRAGTSDPLVMAVPIRSRNRAAFDVDDLTEKPVGGDTYDANVSAVPVLVSLTYDATGGSITVANITAADVGGDTLNAALVPYSGDVNALARATTGSYIVISDDRTTDKVGAAKCEAGSANGRVYRLGDQIGSTATSVTYAVDPSTAMVSNDEDLPEAPDTRKAIGLLVGGRGYENPASVTAAGFAAAGPGMALTSVPQAVSIVP